MDNYLKDFELDHKNPTDEALMRWRRAVTIIKNPRRRFRHVADLAKRSEAERKKRSIQEKIRVALYVKKAALQFIDAGNQAENKVSDEVKKAGFGIEADELASIVRDHDLKALKSNGEVEGIARKVGVSVNEGVNTNNVSVRQGIYGSNCYTEKPPKSFFSFVWEALQDLTLIILIVCAVVSIGVGLATEGWPKGMYDGLGIILSILLVVMVTAISDYKQSLQFRDLDKEKKKISIHVTRDGRKQEVSIFDLVVGDIVQLSIGDVVPADGVFISGYSLVIDESSLSGESEPVNIDKSKPFLLSGTKVQDGSGYMLVTAVGMRTEWGKLMETLNEGGEDETPLQVKLNGVATIIGKIGLGFAVLTFLVLTVRFFWTKISNNELTEWSSADALTLLDYFAIAVTIIVVAVPEGLPLAVTLSLAFAMKKLMDEKALVRHLSACETMGSASCICTDKTGTLTTNHMVVDKICISGKIKSVVHDKSQGISGIEASDKVLSLLQQAIFQNTGCDMTKDEEGKSKILGTPTDKALFELGLHLGADLEVQRKECNILKVEPFNSVKKKMSSLVALPEGGLRAFCKGASEISGYTLVAVVGIKDPVRPGVREAVQTCLAAGITVRMVTGDNINTARAIAKECGILTEGGVAIEGPDFRSKTPDEMRAIIPKIQVMARSLPLDKHTLVTNLKNMFGEVVAVTGDGTNDAPALHEADIGLAMGIAGTEVAKENADIIIMDDNFKSIVNVAKWGRAVYINIQKFVQFQLTVNIVALVLNFISACISGSAPLTAVQLLWVNMIMDTLGALALATEPPNDALMARPPVGRGASFITKTMWRNIFGQSIYQLAILGVLNFGGKQLLSLEGPDATITLNTLIFNSFVFCQVFNEINSREIEKINVLKGMFTSWVFLGVMTATVVFQVIIVELLGTFASTVPLSWELWLLSILLGAVSLIIAVILKCIPVGVDLAPSPQPKKKQHDGYDQLPSGPDLA
ncbi:Putative calcium-transporting ATPase 11, plasma membrane-type [Linum perenne]